MSESQKVSRIDIFGEPIQENELLRDKFIEPPFSVLDTKSGSWQARKRLWGTLGIKSEVGRDAVVYDTTNFFKDERYGKKREGTMSETSIFDPALTEVLYRWFCPEGGSIIDPFAGGSVRGIVANYLGYKYTGIDIRQEQIDSNYEQAHVIVPNNLPNWIVGDSNLVLEDLFLEEYDMVFSCPPYADLEVYSEISGDISNMKYPEFMIAYRSIIKRACDLLKPGGYAVFVVGEVRGKDGGYIGFVPDTIKAFRSVGMAFYNEAILLNAIGTAMLRVGKTFKSGKLVKVHQNVLIFKK